jgi:PIN domain nuclease of toxin-antitoxin system
MAVLDAFAIIAFLRDEPARPHVEKLLRSDEVCRTSAVNLAEMIDVLIRRGNVEPSLVQQQLHYLQLGGLRIEPAQTATSYTAGRLRAAHYRRSDQAISLADCFALALAHAAREPLATADTALATITLTEGIELIALPNSTGHTPTPQS